eukprot:scaffold5582_cov55-Attheya_sp.AAC.2
MARKDTIIDNSKPQVKGLRAASTMSKRKRDYCFQNIKNKADALCWGEKEFVLEAIGNGFGNFQYASEELQGDKVTPTLSLRPPRWIFYHSFMPRRIFEKIVKEFKNDREIVWEAVKHDGEAIEFASEELGCDRELAFVAIKVGSLVVN